MGNINRIRICLHYDEKLDEELYKTDDRCILLQMTWRETSDNSVLKFISPSWSWTKKLMMWRWRCFPCHQRRNLSRWQCKFGGSFWWSYYNDIFSKNKIRFKPTSEHWLGYFGLNKIDYCIDFILNIHMKMYLNIV